jgi:hypothetical protein
MKKLIGVVTAVALMGSGAAFANDQKTKDSQQTQSQGATGGSGSMGSQAGQSGQTSGQTSGQSGQSGTTQQLSGNQLTGRVVKSDSKMVWLEHSGAIVPLKIDKNTQFTDPTLKGARDIKEGDEIRASFEVRKTDNVATSIQKSSVGMGGSGTEVMSPDSSINQSPGTLPPSNDGTGGSGTDMSSPDINKGASSGTGSDVKPNNTSGDY